jgi:hypothetical protein
MAGDPARHPLADGQLDLAHHGVERRGRAPEFELAAPLVQQVHEADVGLGGLGDQPGDAGQHQVQVQAGRDGLDDPGQQLGFPFRVGAAEPAHGQWKTPSRSATATAPARSDTPSLR